MARYVRIAALAFGAVLVPSFAFAQATGGCLLPPAKLSDQALATFNTEPSALLTKHPAGGFAMSSEVRNLAGSDVATVDAIIEIAKAGNSSQQASIGAGLSQAATICVRSRQDLAQLIQQKVAAAGLPDLVTAFLATAQQVDVAAAPAIGGGVGPAGAGAAGIGGAGAGAGGPATNSPGGSSVTSVSAPGNLSSSGGGLFSSSNTNGASPN